MKKPPRSILLLLVLLSIGAGALYLFERSREPVDKEVSEMASGGAVTLERPASDVQESELAASVRAAPEDDPLTRLRSLKDASPEERIALISNLMAIGQDGIAPMLAEALEDPSEEVRIFAAGSAGSLSADDATLVLEKAAYNESADTREVAWSIAAPYPASYKAKIYGAAITRGTDKMAAEALTEMGITPDISLFEMMLYHSFDEALPTPRRQRLFQELQRWLEPGGNVPRFSDPKELLSWWEANRSRYDEFMLPVKE